ncbi:MAG TPA: hypothetical protein VER96_15090 [Polyangiaceae bacterium]|nr:hypothetical protein [Polyangiaceae bacterium]
MTKFTSQQANEIATQAAAIYRATADRIEAVAQSTDNPDDALWEIQRLILGETIGTLQELAQDTLYPALRDAAE